MNLLKHNMTTLLIVGSLHFSSNTYCIDTLKKMLFPSNISSSSTSTPSMSFHSPSTAIQKASPLEIVQDKAQPIIMKVVDYACGSKQMQNDSFFSRYIWNDTAKKWAIPVGIGFLMAATGCMCLELRGKLRRERSARATDRINVQLQLTRDQNEHIATRRDLAATRGRENNLQTELQQARTNLTAAQHQIVESQNREQQFREQVTHAEQAALRMAFGQIIKDPQFTASFTPDDFRFFNTLQLETGQYFWHRAAELGDEPALWVIAGIPPWISDEENDITSPLFKALIEKQVKLTMQLLQLGASPNQPNRHGIHPLHVAVLIKNKALINLLLAKKADINAKTTAGITPLYIATFFKDVSIRDMLLNAKADVIPALALLQEQRNLIAYNRLCNIRLQDEAECIICSETMNQQNKRIVSCCSALFCNECLTTWNKSCPNCRATSFTTTGIQETSPEQQPPVASSSTEHATESMQEPTTMHLNDLLLMDPAAQEERFVENYDKCFLALKSGNISSAKAIVDMYDAVAHTSELAADHAQMLRSLYEDDEMLHFLNDQQLH